MAVKANSALREARPSALRSPRSSPNTGAKSSLINVTECLSRELNLNGKKLDTIATTIDRTVSGRAECDNSDILSPA